MTVKEIHDHMLKEFPEEMQSAVDYHQMALAAKEAGKETEYIYLFSIARDEMTHAKHLHEYLTENGIQIPEDQERRYKELDAAHKFQ